MVVDLQLNLRFSRLIQDGGLFQSQLINIEDGVAGSSSLNAFSLTFSCRVNGDRTHSVDWVINDKVVGLLAC